MPLALTGAVIKTNGVMVKCIAGQGSFLSGTLPLHPTCRPVRREDMLRILWVWQREAPRLWRFLSQANLLSSSLRIYSLCSSLIALSPRSGMGHYLGFTILAWTQESKKEIKAAVQEWDRTRCKFPTCFRAPFYLPSPTMFGVFSFPSLPGGSWCNCLLKHLLQEPLFLLWPIKSSDQQSLAWDSQGKSHKLLLKGLSKSKQNSICRFKSTTVESALPLDCFFWQGFHRSKIKTWKFLIHKYVLPWAKALGSLHVDQSD